MAGDSCLPPANWAGSPNLSRDESSGWLSHWRTMTKFATATPAILTIAPPRKQWPARRGRSRPRRKPTKIWSGSRPGIVWRACDGADVHKAHDRADQYRDFQVMPIQHGGSVGDCSLLPLPRSRSFDQEPGQVGGRFRKGLNRIVGAGVRGDGLGRHYHVHERTLRRVPPAGIYAG